VRLLRQDTNYAWEMTKEHCYQFFNECIEELGITDCKMNVAFCGGSFYSDNCLHMDEEMLRTCPWQIKETILHELAHHLTNDTRDNMHHGLRFYKNYVELLSRFMAGNNANQEMYPLHR